MIASDPGQVERFRDIVALHLGLQFDDTKLRFLAEVLQRRLGDSADGADYLGRLEASPQRNELAALALELTVPETYFFRNIEQFHALREAVLPECMRALSASRPLRILSAGCASGEEPYTIAMLVREALGERAAQVVIRGIDVNRAMLDKAARARFGDWALRETPPDMRGKWFHRSGGESVLDDTIRKAVQFAQRNLVDEGAEFWVAETYDIVFCRNVLMYLTQEKAAAVLARITHALAPGGYLFLGHAETLRGLSQDFHLHHTHGTFYYQRRDEAGAAARDAGGAGHHADLAVTQLAGPGENGSAWVDVIRDASERVHVLTREASSAAAVAPRPARGINAALELLRDERFAQALELVQGLPPEAARGSEMLLLTAVLLTHGGRLTDAEAACRHLLESDEMNAGAHYVLALCRESANDGRGAADHYQTAIYLDPAFAMPRLHLGLLARRAGDYETARRELAQALVLLRREDASRLLLFGGGFSRETLLALGRAELQACGGQP